MNKSDLVPLLCWLDDHSVHIDSEYNYDTGNNSIVVECNQCGYLYNK